MARSNYFCVKDEAAFRSWAENLDLVVFTNDRGRFGFYSNTDDGGFPTERITEGGEEELDLVCELGMHLADGEIAVLMEVGHEKARYVSGFAVALNNAGKRVEFSLSDIYQKAAETFHVNVNSVPEATY